MGRHVIIVDYDPQWHISFEEEKRQILGVVGNIVLEIEHIGSTAVPVWGLNRSLTQWLLLIVSVMLRSVLSLFEALAMSMFLNMRNQFLKDVISIKVNHQKKTITICTWLRALVQRFYEKVALNAYYAPCVRVKVILSRLPFRIVTKENISVCTTSILLPQIC